MNQKSAIAGIAILFLLAGCATSPYETGYDYDEGTLFGQLRSWAWISDSPLVRGEGAPAVSPMLEQRIMDLVEAELAAKGYEQVDDPSLADLAVSFTIGSRDRISVHSYPTTYRSTYGYWGRGWGYGYGFAWPEEQVDVREYTEGQLAIDIFDREARRPVWHGYATGNVRDSWDREERRAVLRQAVADILATFPPS